MRYVVVGASSGLGRALAERLAMDGHELLLVARDQRDLEALAADLSLRFGIKALALAGDIVNHGPLGQQLSQALSPQGADGLLFPVGLSSDDDAIDADPALGRTLLEVNFRGIAVLVRELLPLVISRQGVIVGFGSIAAARGRSVNVMYSAAKRALESYFESLRHALVNRHVRVQFYVPGFLDTGQAFGRRTALPKVSPSAFADLVVRRLDADFGIAYYPVWWKPICWVVRLLPWAVMRRLALRSNRNA